LETNRNSLGIASHCVARCLSSLRGLRPWFDRIASLPEFYIRQVLQDAVEVGLPAADKDFCAEYLLERRTRLLDLVRSNTGSFPKIHSALWDDLADGESKL
jgi:hypothetical protein